VRRDRGRREQTDAAHSRLLCVWMLWIETGMRIGDEPVDNAKQQNAGEERQRRS
jgi:hypothetical protein